MYPFNILSLSWRSWKPRSKKYRTLRSNLTSVVIPPHVYVHNSDLRERWLKLRWRAAAASLGLMMSANMETIHDVVTSASTARIASSG